MPQDNPESSQAFIEAQRAALKAQKAQHEAQMQSQKMTRQVLYLLAFLLLINVGIGAWPLPQPRVEIMGVSLPEPTMESCPRPGGTRA